MAERTEAPRCVTCGTRLMLVETPLENERRHKAFKQDLPDEPAMAVCPAGHGKLIAMGPAQRRLLFVRIPHVPRPKARIKTPEMF